VYILYVKGVSEKFKRVGNRYSIRTIFRTEHTLRSSLMKTKVERDPQQTAQCVCEYGRNYIGKTGSLLAMCDSVNMGTISETVFRINQNYPNMPAKRVIG
jgi:hypothetical protein